MRDDIKVFPEEFLERIKAIIPSQNWHEVAKTFAQPRPTTFRVNTLRSSPERMREALRAQGFQIENVSWNRNAFILRKGNLRDLQETQAYLQGEIYVQGLSSMLPVLILDPQPEDFVLDMTAAPGSKTTQMSCLMRGGGEIVANDNNRIRFFKLKANLKMQGTKNVKPTLRRGETFARTHPGYFNRVLLDAPCSSEGRFNVSEPASYQYWKPAKIREMVNKQKRLLYAAVAALKSGSVIVYATCTFAPEENEGVVDWALGKFGNAIMLEAINMPVPNYLPGLTSWGKESFHKELSLTVRVLPTSQMEGFFIARIRKSKKPLS